MYLFGLTRVPIWSNSCTTLIQLVNRVSTQEFPGSRFPGNLRILAIFPVFPGIKIQDPGNSREFRLFKFPISREMKKSGKMETLLVNHIFMSQKTVQT